MFSAAVLACSFTRNFYIALVFMLFAGFGMLLFFSTSNTVLQTIVPDEMRGRVMGIWSLVGTALLIQRGLSPRAVMNDATLAVQSSRSDS